MHYPIAIGCSYRFEELNVLGEILKLNFKRNWETHCFCNLNVPEFRKYSYLVDFYLIDCFHHIADESCSPKNLVRNEAKRKQPLKMLFKALKYFAEHEQDFMWVEGDFVPFDEEKIIEPFEWLKDYDVIANHFNFNRPISNEHLSPENKQHLLDARSQSHKMPHGYLLPTPMFISGKAAGKIAKFISENELFLTDGTRNHEGNLGLIFHKLGLKRLNFSPYFPITYPLFREMDPNLLFFGPHNLFASGKSLKARGITQGPWIDRVIRDKSYRRPVNWEKIKYDPNCEPVLSEFKIIYAEPSGHS